MFSNQSPVVIFGLSLIISLKVAGFDKNIADNRQQNTSDEPLSSCINHLPPDSYGLIANVIIHAQQSFFWLFRKTWYRDMSLATAEIEGETYSYLIRKGERKGIVFLLHGIMSRKDHLLPLVHHWVKLKKPLPTIIAVDLLGHGSHSYPADYDFTIENFVRHTARFIRYIQSQKGQEPLVILGHSLGGGVAALLRPLENIIAEATILVSPAGVGTSKVEDLKSHIEDSGGLPFDFGSYDVCQLLEIPFEEHTVLFSILLRAGCLAYSFLDCPYETWMKAQMFSQLAISEQQLLSQKSDLEYLHEHNHQPVYLIWTRSDRMLDRSRFIEAGKFLERHNIGKGIELNGSHAWPIEHPGEASELIDSLVEQSLRASARKQQTNPVDLL